jgi:hypothetical protein
LKDDVRSVGTNEAVRDSSTPLGMTNLCLGAPVLQAKISR